MPVLRVLITGKTYPVKEQIKALGGTWDSSANGWRVPAGNADRARAVVSGTLVVQTDSQQRKEHNGRVDAGLAEWRAQRIAADQSTSPPFDIGSP